MSTSTTNIYHSEIQSTVRQKGQLTVPSDVRHALGLQEGDKVAFLVKKDKSIEIVKKQSVVAKSAGVLKSLKPVVSAEQLREQAEHAIAEEAMRRAA